MYEKKINLNWILDFIPNICTYMYISNNNNMVLDIDVGHFDMEKMIVNESNIIYDNEIDCNR